jgi:hypothetical protein
MARILRMDFVRGELRNAMTNPIGKLAFAAAMYAILGLIGLFLLGASFQLLLFIFQLLLFILFG